MIALVHAALLYPKAHAGDQGELHQRPREVQQAGGQPPHPRLLVSAVSPLSNSHCSAGQPHILDKEA